jgi:hypothetical protein
MLLMGLDYPSPADIQTGNKPAAVGTKMIVSSYDGFVSGAVIDYSREGVLYAPALAFTLVCVIFLFVPMLLKGRPSPPDGSRMFQPTRRPRPKTSYL